MVSLVWFRDDLRVRDNAALADAAARGPVLPVYCVDPRDDGAGMFGLPKRGARRARFRLESVADLRRQLRERGADLLVRRGKPERVVPDLAREFDADACFYGELPATEERRAEHAVREALPDRTVPEPRWTKTLHHPDDLPTPVPDIADTFTPWNESVEDSAEAEPREVVPAPDSLTAPDAEFGAVPTLADLGHREPERDERAAFEYRGGSAAAHERIEEWVWEEDNLREYAETRNGLHGPDYSSRFSAWLADGSLSPRELYAAVEAYEAERVANKSTYWLVFELRWRDFMTFQFEKHGAAFFSVGGIRGRDIDPSPDSAAFSRWRAGETGIPFVDAGMRELRATGYLSNRLRQNVASVLANDLDVDWRRGAAHFEAELIDYDVASNWGNWAYQAGVGNDSRDRSFDVLSQAERYDPAAAYVTRWCPALSALPPAYAHRPWRMSADEQAQYGVDLGTDYPRPLAGLDRYTG